MKHPELKSVIPRRNDYKDVTCDPRKTI